MRIAVVGYSCTGKTTLTEKLAALYPDHKIYHTDEYQTVASYEEAPYVVMESMLRSGNTNVIVDGIHAYRLLRKGAEMRSLFFDVVIHCKTDPQTRIDRYTRLRNPEQVHRQPAVEKSLDKIFSTYLGLCNGLGKAPTIIEHWS